MAPLRHSKARHLRIFPVFRSAFVFSLLALCAGSLLALTQTARAGALKDTEVAHAAPGPAVDGLNGKISLEGGSYNDDEEFLASASLTTPIGHLLGLQFDALLGERFNETIAGGGVHVFHRDPARYLIGIYASGHYLDPVTIWRAAVEFELYFGQISVEGIAGYESIELPARFGGLPLVTGDDEHVFTELNIGYYITDDFRITGGYRYEMEENLGIVEAEYAFYGTGGAYSLFARGQFGDEDYEKITAGLRWYFGQNNAKSLKRRHREDDPVAWTPELPSAFNTRPAPQPVINDDVEEEGTENR